MDMRVISAADYLVEFLIAQGVTDVFGYQGGMVCHIFDSLYLYRDQISYHELGNEQGAALAACGYAQATGRLGVVITTSGPGFTNALTGLANAWFDSVPVMLISGQVNTKDKRRDFTLRQYGFQEIQAVPMAQHVAKKTYELDDGADVPQLLHDAFVTAMGGRKGPVYLDFPINIERDKVSVAGEVPTIELPSAEAFDASPCIEKLLSAERPLILAGAGINQAGVRDGFRKLVELLRVPVVTTLPGVDLVPSDSPYHVGYMGGTARREPSVALRYADCVLAIGTRLCNKAIGYKHEQFIPHASTFMRVDIDEAEFERRLKDGEQDILADLRSFIPSAVDYAGTHVGREKHHAWADALQGVKGCLRDFDVTPGNGFVERLTGSLSADVSITLDVGNNLVYGVQSSTVKEGTRVYSSAGLGAMGYSIPAAIGVCIGSERPVYAFTGDGGAQMNIQELNYIAKKALPVKVIVLNNHSLAHIVLFQEHYLDNRLAGTVESQGDYHSCEFSKLAKAYGMRSVKIGELDDIEGLATVLNDDEPLLVEVEMEMGTALPNIHGGLDPLVNGPKLPSDVVSRVRDIMDGRA